MEKGFSFLAWIALLAAAGSATILVLYLVKRPPLELATRVWLFFGLCVLPAAVAAAGTVDNLHTMKQRQFCGSCHVMTRHTGDAGSLSSTSLAARHSRNPHFGNESCYTCHANYVLFGGVLTKLDGMGHVWHFVRKYHAIPVEEAVREIRIRKPFPNHNCMQCHSTQNPVWGRVPDHASVLADVRSGEVSCASAGCHGYAHPFSKDSGK